MADKAPNRIWDGVYRTFAEANADEAVFEGDVWLEKITARAREMLSSAGSDAAISPAATSRDYMLPALIAGLARPDSTIRILDFGGGLGATYVPLVASVPSQQPIAFVIVENTAVCAIGSDLFGSDSRVSFRSDIPTAPERFDVVHCGSSLHYVDDWVSVLRQLIATAPEYLVFADLPAADNRTFVTTQLFHERRIPVRFWNLGEFVAQLAEFGYGLIFKARYHGAFLGPGEPLPTGHFDKEYRLGYVSQLMFRRVSPQQKTEPQESDVRS